MVIKMNLIPHLELTMFGGRIQNYICTGTLNGFVCFQYTSEGR